MRILLIDSDEGRADLAAKLRDDALCICDECEELVPLQAARNALKEFTQAANRSRQSINDEWIGACISPMKYDIVFLHTSNDYSKGYFKQSLVPHVVVMFSGDKQRSWGFTLNKEVTVNPAKHLLVSREELQEYICDFVHEYRPNLPPPWEVFEGRSAPSRVRERLFASVALSEAAVEEGAQPFFKDDLSEPEYLSSVLTRVFPVEAADLRRKAEATLSGDDRTYGRIRQALKGYVQSSAGTVVAGGVDLPAQNDNAIVQLLYLLCTQKKS